MGKTVYLNDKEEKLLIKSLRTQMMNEKDGNNEKVAKEIEDLWDKIANTPNN
jgi:hypothetical protein